MSAKNAPPPLPNIFSPATRDWFTSAFQHPTPVQSQTWAVTAANQHALVIAPTGSGKTLAAFLYALDSLFREGEAAHATSSPAKKRKSPESSIFPR